VARKVPSKQALASFDLPVVQAATGGVRNEIRVLSQPLSEFQAP